MVGGITMTPVVKNSNNGSNGNENNTESTTWTCDICGIVYTKKELLPRHRTLTHLGVIIFQRIPSTLENWTIENCELMAKHLLSEILMEYRFTRKELAFPCAHCSTKLSTWEHIKRHLLISHLDEFSDEVHEALFLHQNANHEN